MRRATRNSLSALLFGGLPTAFPATALASEGEVPGYLTSGSGALALVVAAFLLIGVLALERVAKGSAIAESVGYVVAAVLSLAASVLLGWIARFLETDLSAEQARFASDLLVVASMVFFGVYFYRVRKSLRRYLEGSSDLLAKIQAAEDDERDQEDEGRP